jgi:hypothetical protein
MSKSTVLQRVSEPPRSPFLQITAYYVVVGAVLAAAAALFPPVAEYLVQATSLSGIGTGGNAFDAVAVAPERSRLELAGALAACLTASLVLMVPVSWVYTASRPSEKIRRPIVQHNLALAFSLAGIVAGVRFRTTLKNTMDALFIFIAIGVGLAAGVGALEIAAVVTIFFNYLVLALAQMSFKGPSEAVALVDALASDDEDAANQSSG